MKEKALGITWESRAPEKQQTGAGNSGNDRKPAGKKCTWTADRW